MGVELLRGAEADLLESYVRFEDTSSGLGDRFYQTLDLALEGMRKHPEIAPIYRGAYPDWWLEKVGSDAPDMEDGDLQIIAQPGDSLGLNLYAGTFMREGDAENALPFPRQFPQGD